MGFLAPLAIPLMGAAGAATAGAASATAVGATVAGMGLGAAGSLLGGISQFGQSRYQAQVAENNAKILQTEAGQSLEAGQRDESMQRLKVGETIGSQEAAQGANGVDVNFGSPEMVRANTQTLGDFDALTIRYNAARQAWGQNTEANNQLAQAKMDKSAGNMALFSSFLGAASSVAGGLGKLGSMGMQNASVGLGSSSGGLSSSTAKMFSDVNSFNFGAA